MSKNLLMSWEIVLCLTCAIDKDLLPLELGSICLDRGDIPYPPSDAQIDLLNFPILQHDCTPDACQDGISQRVFASQVPCYNASGSWECETDQVRLEKGEIKSDLYMINMCLINPSLGGTYLGPEQVSYPIEVMVCEDQFSAQVFQ